MANIAARIRENRADWVLEQIKRITQRTFGRFDRFYVSLADAVRSNMPAVARAVGPKAWGRTRQFDGMTAAQGSLSPSLKQAKKVAQLAGAAA
jgi:hypothetical protein